MGWRYYDPPPMLREPDKFDVPEFPPEVPYWLHGETARFYKAWEPAQSKWKVRAWSWAAMLSFVIAAFASSPWVRVPAILILVCSVMETAHRRGHWNGFRRGFMGGRMNLRGE